MKHSIFLGLAALLFPSLATAAAARQIQVQLSSPTVARFSRLDMVVGGDIRCENPGDPEQVRVDAELTAPSGRKLSIPGFFYQPFERKPLFRGGGNSEWIYPVGQGQWHVRFAPSETGTWTGAIVVSDSLGQTRSAQFTFEALASNDHGFLRVSPADHHYLAFDDGTPCFAIGQNIAFVKDSYSTIDKIRKLGSAGGNFARVWACGEDWAMAIEARKSAFGRSWAWNPPIVAWPDREGYHTDRLCLKVEGDAGASLNVSPSHPVGLKPNTRYKLNGLVRTDVSVEIGLPNHPVLAPKRGWAKFSEEFTTDPQQWWLGDFPLRLKEKGRAYIGELSLKESSGGPELLWEADVNRPALGVYNQVDSYMLDQVLEGAESSGIYLQLCLLTRDHYMSLLGNEKSPDYDGAIRYAKKFLRYAVARWGYSTHVAAWEYFNEINPGLPTDRFYTELGEELERIDVNHHLRATSAWSMPSKEYTHPKLDLAEFHHYLRPANGEIWKDETATVLSKIQYMRQRVSDKPILFAEYGITDNNWQHGPELEKDKDFSHLHRALWASMLSGYAGTTWHWYWDDIERKNLYHLYTPVARFAATIPWTTGLAPARCSCDSNLRAIGLRNENSAWVWLADPDASWFNTAVNGQKPQERKGATLTFEGLKPGPYQVNWWDTRQGKVISTASARSADQKLTCPVPDFTADIACQIIPTP